MEKGLEFPHNNHPLKLWIRGRNRLSAFFCEFMRAGIICRKPSGALRAQYVLPEISMKAIRGGLTTMPRVPGDGVIYHFISSTGYIGK